MEFAMLVRIKPTVMIALFKAGRPLTGVYAFLLALVSFKFFDWQNWEVGIYTGLLFAFLTMSIMRFNDLVDRQNDLRKGKSFAIDHYTELRMYWLCEAVALMVGLVGLMLLSVVLGTFCVLVWLAGLLYSFVPRWYIVQNVLVALCSGSPALCAMFYFGTFEYYGFCTFGVLTALIWLSEVHKDIADRATDKGYKVTLPTQLGGRRSVLLLVASLHIVAATFYWHPIYWLQLVALTLVPKMAYEQGLTLLNQARIDLPMATMNQVILATGIILFLA